MNKFYYKIATLTMCVEGGETALLGNTLPGIQAFKVGALDEVDILVYTDCEMLTIPTPIKEQIICDMDLEGVRYLLAVVDEHIVFEMRTNDRGNFKLSHERGSKIVRLAPCNDLFSLKFMLWNAYALVALNKGVVPIHASAVIKDKAAVLCLGESGTGKSTHTRMWMENINGTSMLNDDSPLLKMDGNKLRAYGSPWSGKMDFYINEDYEVKGIMRIKRALHNTIDRLDAMHSLVSVYPSLPPMYAHDTIMADKMLDLVSDIIETTAIYILACLPNGDAARVAYKELYGAKDEGFK